MTRHGDVLPQAIVQLQVCALHLTPCVSVRMPVRVLAVQKIALVQPELHRHPRALAVTPGHDVLAGLVRLAPNLCGHREAAGGQAGARIHQGRLEIRAAVPALAAPEGLQVRIHTADELRLVKLEALAAATDLRVVLALEGAILVVAAAPAGAHASAIPRRHLEAQKIHLVRPSWLRRLWGRLQVLRAPRFRGRLPRLNQLWQDVRRVAVPCRTADRPPQRARRAGQARNAVCVLAVVIARVAAEALHAVDVRLEELVGLAKEGSPVGGQRVEVASVQDHAANDVPLPGHVVREANVAIGIVVGVAPAS
mmetsp:Transcript_64581/g.197562  ORF Transcript_64581/g.197562 Transcript_64581/m.197562 type:complete len:309 (-) Transcript_64581:928-1854(-)